MQLGRERLSALKGTQTAIEAGFPDFETLAWWGVFAPKGTPADVTGKMAKEIREILSEPAASTPTNTTATTTATPIPGKTVTRGTSTGGTAASTLARSARKEGLGNS